MTRKVVVTGMGCITPSGKDIATLWSSMIAGKSAIRPFKQSGCDLHIASAARVEEFNPENYFYTDQLPFLDRFSQFAVIAAREALANSGLSENEDILATAAGIIGTGCGGKQTDEETYKKLYKEGRSRVHPLTIPKGMPSAAASQVSSHTGIKGPVFSIASACASGAHAIIQGMVMIKSGLVDVALVGGTDAPFTCGLLKSWEALRALSEDTCRPFSKDRTGLVLGEGAAMLVIESEEHALLRGANCQAEIAGFGMSSDAGHITRPDMQGISNAINKAIQMSGLSLDEIGYINAHGTGTIMNDIAETEAINNVFGDHARRLAVTSTKSMHGHALGAASAIEMVVTVMSINACVIPPTANFTSAGDGCNLDYVPNVARSAKFAAALSNSFAFGGLNAVVAVRAINS